MEPKWARKASFLTAPFSRHHGHENQRKLNRIGVPGMSKSRAFSRHGRPLSRNAAAFTNFEKSCKSIVFYSTSRVSALSAHSKKTRTARGKNNRTTTPQHYRKAPPATHQTHTKKHQKTFQNQPKKVSERPLFLASRPAAPESAPETPKNDPGSAQRRAKRGQRRPKRPPEASRNPPGAAQNGSKCNKPIAVCAQNHPRSRPRRLRRPFSNDFGLPGTYFSDFSGLLLASVSFLFFDFRLTRRQGKPNKPHKNKQRKSKPQHPRSPRDSTRRAGGVLPTWRPGRLQEAILGGFFRDLGREVENQLFSLCFVVF